MPPRCCCTSGAAVYLSGVYIGRIYISPGSDRSQGELWGDRKCWICHSEPAARRAKNRCVSNMLRFAQSLWRNQGEQLSGSDAVRFRPGNRASMAVVRQAHHERVRFMPRSRFAPQAGPITSQPLSMTRQGVPATSDHSQSRRGILRPERVPRRGNPGVGCLPGHRRVGPGRIA